MSDPVPVLVIAVGNPSRGDDAIGPALAARIEEARLPGVEVIVEFQLQVENALDLVGRERVVFVDAGAGTPAPYELRLVAPAGDFLHTSHALPPEAVLATFARITGSPPPEAWLLVVSGESFGLGDGLSGVARAHLEPAWLRLQQLAGAGSGRWLKA